jgi:hypothetical protein
MRWRAARESRIIVGKSTGGVWVKRLLTAMA